MTNAVDREGVYDRVHDGWQGACTAGLTTALCAQRVGCRRDRVTVEGEAGRIGSARDGSVRYFIPDPDPQGGSSAAEGVAAIRGGAVVYGAEVGPTDFVRYDRR